jgi:integrase
VTVGFKLDGSPDRRWVSGKTVEDTRAKMEALKTLRIIGMIANGERLTVAEFLDRWLVFKAADGTKPKTMAGNEWVVQKRLKPIVGRFRLEKLRPFDVQSAINVIRKEASVHEARRARMVLSLALNQAMRWEVVPRNVCQAVKPPSIPEGEEYKARFWNPKEVRSFLNVAKTHRQFVLFYVALMTGMRSGELLGLRWKDIDFKNGLIKIEQNAVEVLNRMVLGTPKTKASRRTISISEDTVVQLLAHRERQKLEIACASEGYTNNGLVFASEIGSITHYSNLRNVFKNLIARANVEGWKTLGLVEARCPTRQDVFGQLCLERPELKEQLTLPDLNLHGLRHTHASVLIRRKVNPKVVSDRLGHTNISFTLTVYAHLFNAQRREAAISLEDFLGDEQDD